MVANSNAEDNPYSPPREATSQASPSLRLRIARWLLNATGVFLIVLSLPGIFHVLELANQEYLHLWEDRRSFYDIEINGVPVSTGTAMLVSAIEPIVMWAIAAGLFALSRSLKRRRAK